MTEHRSPVGRLFGAVVPLAVDAIDVDELVGQLDVDALMERVDVDALLTRIDIDALLARIDIENLLGRIDLGALIGRIDMNELIGQVDLNQVLAGVDLNALMDGIDVKALVDKAGIEQIVAEASTGIFARTLDLARRQIVGLDIIIMGMADRVFHRGRTDLTATDVHRATGRAAGPVSRLLAFGVDLFLVSTIFSLVVYFGRSMVEIFTGDAIQPTDGTAPLLWGAAYFLWFGAYLWTSIEIAGRTPGKALIGLRVSALDGTPIGPGRALARTIAFPFSFILGLGFIPAITRKDRRAFHELVAGCKETVDWGGREAGLPSALESWIARQREERLEEEAKTAAVEVTLVAETTEPTEPTETTEPTEPTEPAADAEVAEPEPVEVEPVEAEVVDEVEIEVALEADAADEVEVEAEGDQAGEAESTSTREPGEGDYWAS